MGLILLALSLIVTLVTSVLLYFRKMQHYWESRGIPHEPASFIVGNLKGIGTDLPIMEPFNRTYRKFKNSSPVAGMVFLINGLYLVTDLDLAKAILIKDFQHFNDRNMYVNEKDDPLTAHLFSLKGKQWKDLRTKLTPAFSSGKMKFMFSTIVEVSKTMGDIYSKKCEEDFIIEARDAMGRYTLDVIGKCAFGLDTYSMEHSEDEFVKMGRKAFGEQRHGNFVTNLINNFQSAANLFRMKVIREDVSEFFLNIVKETVSYREMNNIHKNDFMNLLIELKNGTKESRLTMNEVSAQAFLFFVAGFETTAATMSFLLYHLAINQEIQNKAREEVLGMLKKSDGNFEYENLKDLVYLEKLLNETLRMYPPAPFLMRNTLDTYKIADSNITLEKNKQIIIPTYAIHHDPDIYLEPEVFNPERFSPEETAKRHPLAFLPFGDGPRICVGMRFAKMQAFVGLVELLSRFKFHPTENTPKNFIFENSKFFLTPKNGIPLRIEIL